MKVLHLVNYGWPWIDGYTVRSQGLVSAQARVLGWDVDVATSAFGPLTTARDEQATTPAWSSDQVRLGRSARFWERPGLDLTPRATRALERDLRERLEADRPDVVHVHHPHYVARPALRVARALGIPTVYEIRCFNGDYDVARSEEARSEEARPGGARTLADRWAGLRGARFNQLERAACDAADVVVTISDGLAARVRAARNGRHASADRGVFVVRNSVDPQRFARAESEPSEPRAPGAPFRIGYATTFARIEGLDGLVESFVSISEDVRPLQLAIAGTGDDWRRIAALVDRLGARDRIELPGFVPFSRMGDVYGRLDLFVVPRLGDGPTRQTPPLKPLEALAAGVPVLAPDLPALRELLMQDDAPRRGVRFFEPTADGLREGLRRAVDEPIAPPDASSVADRAWDREVERYREVYRAAVRVAEGSAP